MHGNWKTRKYNVTNTLKKTSSSSLLHQKRILSPFTRKSNERGKYTIKNTHIENNKIMLIRETGEIMEE